MSSLETGFPYTVQREYWGHPNLQTTWDHSRFGVPKDSINSKIRSSQPWGSAKPSNRLGIISTLGSTPKILQAKGWGHH